MIADAYDRQAYERLMDELAEAPSLLNRTVGRVQERVGRVGRRAADAAPDALAHGAERVLRTTLSGLQGVTVDPALRSVRVDRVVDAYAGRGHAVTTLDDIRHLRLEVIDAVTPGLGWRYALGAAAEGAGAGAVITGGELLASAGTIFGAGAGSAPGAGTVLAAMAVDAAAVIAASARVVAHVGAYHGYDARLLEEQVFALTVISWSNAAGESAKVTAFQQLSRITQQLVRRATWAQLSEHALVKVVQELYTRLGIRLTQRKLGQAVPVLGVVLGAGMNAEMLRSVAHDAHAAYRARHLAEKYGVTFGRPGDPDDATHGVSTPEVLPGEPPLGQLAP